MEKKLDQKKIARNKALNFVSIMHLITNSLKSWNFSEVVVKVISVRNKGRLENDAVGRWVAEERWGFLSIIELFLTANYLIASWLKEIGDC